MKYIITENRMMVLVEELIKMKYPCFANAECDTHYDEEYLTFYYDSNRHIAVYDDYWNQLELEQTLFNTLVDFLGEDILGYVIQWFNKKYNKYAITIRPIIYQ